MIFQGGGGGSEHPAPPPPSGSAHDIVNCIRPHIVLATILTPVGAEVLHDMDLLFSDRIYAWGIKRCVVCNKIIGKRPCIIPNVGCEGSFYNVTGIYRIRNYPHALSQNVCGDHKRTDLIKQQKKKKKTTLFCIFVKCVSLSTRCDFIAIRF